MSTHVCSQCNHEEAIFGAGGGESLAQQYGTKLLASLPLSMDIRLQVDGGTPTVVSEPESKATKTYSNLAAALVRQLDNTSHSMPNISVDEE
jgi:ATP-binding protein involved in chromosome partitioning